MADQGENPSWLQASPQEFAIFSQKYSPWWLQDALWCMTGHSKQEGSSRYNLTGCGEALAEIDEELIWHWLY